PEASPRPEPSGSAPVQPRAPATADTTNTARQSMTPSLAAHPTRNQRRSKRLHSHYRAPPSLHSDALWTGPVGPECPGDLASHVQWQKCEKGAKGGEA